MFEGKRIFTQLDFLPKTDNCMRFSIINSIFTLFPAKLGIYVQ